MADYDGMSKMTEDQIEIKRLRRIINRFATRQWHPIIDLPPDFEEVIIALKEGDLGIGYFVRCKGYIRMRFNGVGKAMEYWNITPTHWMYVDGILGPLNET